MEKTKEERAKDEAQLVDDFFQLIKKMDLMDRITIKRAWTMLESKQLIMAINAAITARASDEYVTNTREQEREALDKNFKPRNMGEHLERIAEAKKKYDIAPDADGYWEQNQPELEIF